MRSLLLLTAVAAAPALARPAAAQDSPSPKAVVEKAIKAYGGAELLNKYPASRSTIRSTITAMGMQLEMSGELVVVHPDKSKLTGTASVAGMEFPFVQVVDGKKLTATVGGNPVPVPEAQVADALTGVYVASLSRLTPLLAADYTLKMADAREVDGKPAVGVVVSRKDRPDVTLHFDKATGLLVRSAYPGKAEGGGDAEWESLYLDYKPVSGLQVPHKGKTLVDGKVVSELTAEKVELLEKAPAGVFGDD